MSQRSTTDEVLAARQAGVEGPVREACGCRIESAMPGRRTGERWLGRRRAGGEPVVLYRYAEAAGRVGVSWPRVLGRLRGLAGRYVLAVEDGQIGHDGSVWLRCPYPGTYDGLLTLPALLARKPGARLGVGEAAVAIRQVMSASARAHRMGVVHGAVQPDEVLVDRRAMIRLECYGVEHELGMLQGPVAALATAELRSIGSLAHLMLAGALPGPGWERSLRRESRVPRGLQRWLGEALSVDGFATADAALRALESA